MLIELYNYLCCITSTTSEKVPQRFGTLLDFSPSEITTHSDTPTIHPLYGLSSSLYQCLARVNKLAARLNDDSTISNTDEVKKEIQNLELMLQGWSPPVETYSRRYMIEARAAAFATQWAVMIRLQQVIRQPKKDDQQIKKAVENIFSALSLIRPGSVMEAHMLFPIFIAGVWSMTKPYRLTIEYRINIMKTTVGFGNISVAHRLLVEFWQGANQGEIVNWEVLMHKKYPGLALF